MDIGKIKVQIFEEALRTAFGQDHTLCIFRETCGGVPVLEHNGDFYSCDHFVEARYRIGNIKVTPLADMIESREQKAFGQTKLNSLPRFCLKCEVRDMCNGGCPKDRFTLTPDGEAGLNYLCSGFKLFFTHIQPFVDEVKGIWKTQNSPIKIPGVQPTAVDNNPKTGRTERNDPCPCGSGKKFKNCCLE